ncbi:hypothetical protein O6P43_026178 [Quillaja saponaria]|uniref:Uncharacterized protein n=1 Tax=Quillaja saponaria TaxID=32244 RepID=A0AAD7LAN8_QUISA|nr:hypothetical protein O6P43_026178 [Quillaja saponaria]
MRPSPLILSSCFCRGDLLLQSRILGFSLAAHLACVQLPSPVGLAVLAVYSSSNYSCHSSRWLPPSIATRSTQLTLLSIMISANITNEHLTC